MNVSLTSFFVRFSVSPEMYNKVRKDIPQLSSHIYIVSLRWSPPNAHDMSTLLSPKRGAFEQAGIAFGEGEAVEGRDR